MRKNKQELKAILKRSKNPKTLEFLIANVKRLKVAFQMHNVMTFERRFYMH